MSWYIIPEVLMDYMVAIPRNGSRIAKLGTEEDFAANGVTAECYDIYPTEPAGAKVSSPEHFVRRLLAGSPTTSRITLIKQARDKFGLGLLEAKEIVDRVCTT